MTIDPGTIQVFADVRCPWCWVGHRRLAEARNQVAGNNDGPPAKVVHRAFLLEPDGPPRSGISVREAALNDWGMSIAQYEATRERTEAAGRAEGLTISMDTARIFDSRPIHRLLKLAAATPGIDVHGAWEVVFDRHFHLNEDFGSTSVLVDVGSQVGLGDAVVERILAGRDFDEDVDRDVQDAHRLGVRAVPTVISGEVHLAGSRSVTELVDLLARTSELTR
ncbi:DsbA family oxidoreductase [Rhodococcus sp. H29-C3]|uniref:DsbA family oxidoreductase n=1 Tax=Rhodococcus sp. H29-C3 TaxID=3046307 RepID=UPI0024BA2CAF|nr:DsbA family oxidoreductase [Rhodococcus sp. H29-C3]MDJ0363373.1 DsbA family oxidoreductase [Rhodococcus sp. H29-C3]